MRITIAITIAAGLMVVSAFAQNKTPLEVGKEQTLEVENVPGPVKVRLPSNYDPNQAWPVLFYYHGLNGFPDTAFLNQYTGGLDYIIVGVEYIQRGLTKQDLKMAYAETKNLHVVIKALRKQARVDPARIYLVGLSKGGGLVGSIAELEPGIAGVAILLAGRPRNQKLVKPDSIRDKPFYIGVGETDGNNPLARRTAEFYDRWRVDVTFEEYAGVGHSVPQNPVLFRDWLKARGGFHKGMADAETRKELGAWYKSQWAKLEGATSPAEAYDAMVAFAENPLLDLCLPPAVEKVEDRLDAMRDVEPFKSEWRAEKDFARMLYQEEKIRSLKDMADVLNGLKEIAMNYPDTKFGKKSFEHGKRVAEAYKKSQNATTELNRNRPKPVSPVVTKPVAPVFPSDPRRNARPPKRDGNTISF